MPTMVRGFKDFGNGNEWVPPTGSSNWIAAL